MRSHHIMQLGFFLVGWTFQLTIDNPLIGLVVCLGFISIGTIYSLKKNREDYEKVMKDWDRLEFFLKKRRAKK